MKRRYFFRVLDLIKRSSKLLKAIVGAIAVLCTLKGFLIYVHQYLGELSVLVTTGTNVLTMVIKWLVILFFLLIGGMILLLLPEIISRLKHDSIKHMLQSIRLTFKARKFLTKTSDEGIFEFYNAAVRTIRVDLNGRRFILAIDLPNNRDVQKILFEESKDLAVQMGSFLDENYIFSSVKQVRSYLVLEATQVL